MINLPDFKENKCSYLSPGNTVSSLTLIWVGFLGVCFKVTGGGGGGEFTLPVLKSLKLYYKLKIWHVSTHLYVVSENIQHMQYR